MLSFPVFCSAISSCLPRADARGLAANTHPLALPQKSSKSSTMNTYEKCFCNLFRMNTCGTKDLKSLCYQHLQKTGGGGRLWLTSHQPSPPGDGSRRFASGARAHNEKGPGGKPGPLEWVECGLEVAGVVEPLEALDAGRVRRDSAGGGSDGGRREPGRREVVLRVTAIEEDVTRGGVDVLDVVLNTAAEDGQGVDGAADVGEAAGAVLRDCRDGGVNFKVAVALGIVHLDVARGCKDAQGLAVVVAGNERIGRRVRNLVLRRGDGLGRVEEIARDCDVAGGSDRERGVVGQGGLTLSRTAERGDVAVDVEHGSVALESTSCGVKLNWNANDRLGGRAAGDCGGVRGVVDRDGRDGRALGDRIHLCGAGSGRRERKDRKS